MKYSILTLVLAVGTTAGYAQVQSNTNTEHAEEHSSTRVTPDGTAVQHRSATNERTDSTANSDGSTSTTKTKTAQSKTKVRSNATPVVVTPAPVVEEHNSSTTTTTHDEVRP